MGGIITESYLLFVNSLSEQIKDQLPFRDEPGSLIFGFLWLTSHNPLFNWPERRIESWTLHCLQNCLKSDISTSVKGEEHVEETDLSKVSKVYHDLAPVFSKSKALSLRPHRPYNCSIELIPGSPIPSSHLYNLCGPEKNP